MGLFGGDDNEGYIKARQNTQANEDLINAIGLPQYAQYNPELYSSESADYALTQDDPVTKSLQMQALARLSGLAESGQSAEDEAGFNQARSEGDQMAHAGTAAAIQNAEARGVGGSGMEFAMREMANQGGAQRAQQGALQQAADSAKQRALYQQAYAQAISGARDQDYKTNAANTGVINQFNLANTNTRNQTNNANVDQQNQAFQYNQGLQDKNYKNQLDRADRLTGFNDKQTEISLAEQDAEKKRRAALGTAIGTGVGAIAGGPVGAGVGGAVGGSIA